MKLLMAAAGVAFLLGACAPQPAQHYYTSRTIYYTPKKKSTPTYTKYGGGGTRTISGASAESFRATTR